MIRIMMALSPASRCQEAEGALQAVCGLAQQWQQERDTLVKHHHHQHQCLQAEIALLRRRLQQQEDRAAADAAAAAAEAAAAAAEVQAQQQRQQHHHRLHTDFLATQIQDLQQEKATLAATASAAAALELEKQQQQWRHHSEALTAEGQGLKHELAALYQETQKAQLDAAQVCFGKVGVLWYLFSNHCVRACAHVMLSCALSKESVSRSRTGTPRACAFFVINSLPVRTLRVQHAVCVW